VNSILNRRDFVKAMGLAVTSLVLPGCDGTSKLPQSDVDAKRPNIIFIIADDMGYGDYVVEVDWTIGQVVRALERNGLAGNTLIIVTSDNGSPGRTKINRATYSIIKEYGHYPNGDLRDIKADIWDGGHREPFIARWPGKIPAGTACDELICLTDLLEKYKQQGHSRAI